MPRSFAFLLYFMLSAELTRCPMGILSEPIRSSANSGVYPKINIVNSQFSEARLELSGRSNDDFTEYPSIRVALNDDLSAEISQPLPLNKTVHGVVGERDVKMYASKLPNAGGGALKLFVQARGRPEPSQAAPLIVSVRTHDGGYTFILPQLAKSEMHHHAHPVDVDAVTPAPSSMHSMSVSRFMCPSAGERDVCYVTIGVGTSVGPDTQHVVYDYDLRLMELDADFWYLNTSSAPRGVVITPIMPALFQFHWPPDRSVEAVRVSAASGKHLMCAADARTCVGDDCTEEGDVDACSFLAVHKPICPLTLTPAEILASAWHMSFTRCGTMVVRRKYFPDGFFVSVFLHGDDNICCLPQQCHRNDTLPRRKSVRVSVMDYEANFEAAAAAGLMGALFIFMGVVSVCLRPVLARAAVRYSFEPVAVARAISSRFMGHPQIQIGLELGSYEGSESGITVDGNGEQNRVYPVNSIDDWKTNPNALNHDEDSQAGTGVLNHRSSCHSETDAIIHSDGSRPETSGEECASTSGTTTDPEVTYSGEFKTRFGSFKNKDELHVRTSVLGSGIARPTSSRTSMKHNEAVNRPASTTKNINGKRKESSFVRFSDTNQAEKGDGITHRAAVVMRQVSQVPESQSTPLLTLASNAILLHPVTLQLTCALLIAAFGISNVAIDVAAERRTGNFDRCYRNDLCCHDGHVMPDVNHLLSNVPYIGAGIGFLLAVYAQRHVYEVAAMRFRGRARGVPHDFNLFTAIGSALAIEGVTSGLYHVCPNNRNSHIDFFFIYYLCAAMGAKLFQTRRGVTTRFHYTPAMLVATITLLGSLQQVPGVTPHSWQLAVVSTHFSSSFLWAAQMYLTGHVGLFVPWCWEITSDLRTRRLAAAHIILNGGLALWGLLSSSPGEVFHSSTYALLYFSLNSGLYVCFYMIMKLVVCRERPPWLSVFNITVGIASAVPALYFFVIRKSYNTNESPAVSRIVNHPCVLFGFYDAHDIWHFMSASALFFLMLGVLTLDDDLLATPRERIPVF